MKIDGMVGQTAIDRCRNAAPLISAVTGKVDVRRRRCRQTIDNAHETATPLELHGRTEH